TLMTALAQRLKDRFFPEEHPYRVFENEVDRYLLPSHTLLDAGCGRSAPILVKYRGKAARLIGADVVDFQEIPNVELLKNNLEDLALPAGSVDIVMARSVMEHVADPAAV